VKFQRILEGNNPILILTGFKLILYIFAQQYLKMGIYKKTEEFQPEAIDHLSNHVKGMLQILGEDTSREGLEKTPSRVAKSLGFMTKGYDEDAVEILKSALFVEETNEMVVVKDIELYSMCEHHMLPFYGKAHIGYLPRKHITGLSKMARVVDVFSRRLQVQERLTMEIKDAIQEALDPLGVAVVIEAKHLCMMMRGVQKQNSSTVTSSFNGEFLNNLATRKEFLNVISTKLS
jgi:GTP cyclohydrolase IA